MADAEARSFVGVDHVGGELPAVERAGGEVGAVAGHEAEEDVDGRVGVRRDELDEVAEAGRQRRAQLLEDGRGRHEEHGVADDRVEAAGGTDAAEHDAGLHPVGELVRHRRGGRARHPRGRPPRSRRCPGRPRPVRDRSAKSTICRVRVIGGVAGARALDGDDADAALGGELAGVVGQLVTRTGRTVEPEDVVAVGSRRTGPSRARRPSRSVVVPSRCGWSGAVMN